MSENKLVLLMKLYEEYWDNEVMDIDLANQIIDQVPSLVREIKELKEEKQQINIIVNEGLTNYDITALEDIRNITD